MTLALTVPARAATWTVDDDGVQFPGANFTTVQAAINAASDGDTILVYPGTYDPQINITVPGWGGTYPAQGIVVWKNNLTIKAVDPDPAQTVVQNTLGAWMDWWRIQYLTGGVWTASPPAQTGGFNPGTSASPNAIMIVKSGTIIEGFTIHAHCYAPAIGYNGSGVLIGAVAPGVSTNLGANNNTVRNCVFSDVWQAVYVWHSSGNTIAHNTVAALGNTGAWAGITVYDGYNNTQIGYGNLSENNLIYCNTVADKGISLGAWDPATWTSIAGSRVLCNTSTQIGIAYAHGPVYLGCNTGGFWQVNTDNIFQLTGVTYTGDTFVQSGTAANLSGQVGYTDGDGSGIHVTFIVNGTQYPVTTTAGGGATYSPGVLAPGVYTVTVSLLGGCESACTCGCTFSETVQLVVSALGLVTGGGWFNSAAGADKLHPSATGKANFSIVAQNVSGAPLPIGKTVLRFTAGSLNFRSTGYDWLVVNSIHAQYQGSGMINETGGYKFMVWATDNGRTDDTLRMRIWNSSTDEAVYDNDVEQVIGCGQIIVRAK